MPFLPLDTPDALEAIGRLLPEGAHLAAGALRVEAPPAGRTRRRIFNSLMIFGQEGRLAGLYDKIHLVPFGEYLPFQSTLEALGLEQLTRIRGGFDIGITLEANGFRESRTPWDCRRLARSIAISGRSINNAAMWALADDLFRLAKERAGLEPGLPGLLWPPKVDGERKDSQQSA